tara:strand:+ start:702 stop:983 length:282 start_codon:yes stop_codon:yes gene_type:complete
MNHDKATRVRHRFVGLYCLLLGLLGANMVGTLIDAGALAIPIRLSVAGVMVVVIATTFMRLRQSSPLVQVVAVMSLLWIMFLFVLTFADFLTR